MMTKYLVDSAVTIIEIDIEIAIECDRNRDLSYSIFTEFCWVMAASVITKVIMPNVQDFVGTEALGHNGMTTADVLFTLTSPHCLVQAKPQ